MNLNAIKILSIDDEIKDLSIIERYSRSLSMGVESYQDPQKITLSSTEIDFDLVLIKCERIKFNMLEFIKTFRKMNKNIPIIVLTSTEDDVSLYEKALKLGANDFLNKPINFASFQARIQNTLELSKLQALMHDKIFLLEDEVQKATVLFKENEHETLDVLGKCVQYNDYVKDSHILRIAHICKLLAKEAGLSEKVQDLAFHSSKFYDLGKLGISDEILLKPGKLDEQELEIMKTHSRAGYDILKYTQSSYLKAGAIISYSHHERYDGSGYPIGLKGETIPILGRIVTIADVFDALTSKRPYKEAESIEEACAYLLKEKGKHFDPNLVDVFIQNLDAIRSIKDKYK
ncbi:response regulator [Sulfurimonas sp. MAG313]|nr:HD domain-containing phosphohydrolase [Sulfurimonas sp. MAG313]MDF1880732.1 response regulator [Sulfurimonas sp. MAG313]